MIQCQWVNGNWRNLSPPTNVPCLLHFHHLQKSNRPKERQTLSVYINFSSNPSARSLLPSFLFQMYICMYTHTFFLFFFFFSFWTRSYCTGYCYFHVPTKKSERTDFYLKRFFSNNAIIVVDKRCIGEWREGPHFLPFPFPSLFKNSALPTEGLN